VIMCLATAINQGGPRCMHVMTSSLCDQPAVHQQGREAIQSTCWGQLGMDRADYRSFCLPLQLALA
jgi:hypothetical protein